MLIVIFTERSKRKITITGIPLYVFGDYGRSPTFNLIEANGADNSSATEDIARLPDKICQTTELASG